MQLQMRVLIVDDHPGTAETLAVLVSRWGHEACIASGAAEALTSADAFQPHVILLDIMLPDGHGADVAKALHQRPSGKDAVIIAVSGYPQEAKRAYLGQSLFDDYFLKPIEPAILEQVLRSEQARLRQLGKLTAEGQG